MVKITGTSTVYSLSNFFKSSALKWFFNPFPNDNILDWFKMKEFADDNFKFDLNGRKFKKWVENTVGKGEIACYE